MSSVQCPYCGNSVAFKSPDQPGRYTTTCAKCGRKYVLTVSSDPNQPPGISGMKSERAIYETTAAASSSASSPSPEPEVTGAWESNAAKSLRKTDVPPPTEPAPSRSPIRQAIPPTRPMAQTTTPDSESSRADGGFITLEHPSSSSVATSSAPVTLKIGGYQVLKELGRGGMGAVYLARQLSLNRNVALKVMKPEWASNATFVARFTREAYAAAQLTHHNVVQIFDFGEDHGTTYFSMEFVEGETLAALVRRKKRLEVEEAVGYVLQAARGLKHAHEQSMIHRDIKPENLLLSRQGVVKVADLGLVKTPESAELDDAPPGPREPMSASAANSPFITQANVAMGTPSFMAPEQATDAARVDARADIYSLGCSLYDLITGRPPFEGKTAVEIMSKHQTEEVLPPDMVVKNVPKVLSEIIVKMVAKRPEDRYPDLNAVIAALESLLGVRASGSVQIREEYADTIEENARIYRSSPSARLRALILPLVLASCSALAILGLFARKPTLAIGLLGLAVMTALADFVIDGVRRKSYLFGKTRQLLFNSPLSDWLMMLAGLTVVLAGLYVFNLFWIWVFLSAAAVCLALGLNIALDRKADIERAEALESSEKLLRTLRLHGLDEEALRQFVCRYSGDHWEEFYEALFGYESKIEARARWSGGLGASARPKFGIWRDPVVRWIDAKQKARIEAKDRKLLEKIEEKSLEAQGENLMTARRKAKRAAEAMVAVASEMKESQAVTKRHGGVTVNHSIARAIREAALKPENVLVHREKGLLVDSRQGLFGRVFEMVADNVIGPRPRFLVGAALVAACLFWMKQNGIVSKDQAEAIVSAAQAGDIEAIKAQGEAGVAKAKKAVKTRPLEVRAFPIPKPLLELVSSFGAGAAGLTLLFSSFFRGTRISLFAVPAAAIMILGPKAGLPLIQGVDPSFAPAVVGLVIMGVGLLLGRSRA